MPICQTPNGRHLVVATWRSWSATSSRRALRRLLMSVHASGLPLRAWIPASSNAPWSPIVDKP